MNRPKMPALSCVLVALAAVPCLGGEAGGEYDEDMLSPKERAELQIKRRREARPILACEPSSLNAKAKQHEVVTLRLTVLNKGGQVLRWSTQSAPAWLSLDENSGELGFKEKTVVVVTAKCEPVGTAHGSIVLEARGAANSPLAVPITFEIERALPSELPPRRPPEEPLPSQPVTSRDRRGRFGARAGVLMPGSGEKKNFGLSAVIGLQYRFQQSSGSKLCFEAGLETAEMNAQDGSEAIQIYVGDFDVLFTRQYGSSSRGYLLSGLGVLADATENDTAYVGTLNLGGGFEFDGGRWDLRLAHRVLLGSNNVGGLTVLTAGVSF